MWSDAARKAAAAARKAKGTTRRSKGGRTLKRENNAQRAQGVRFGAEAHGRVGPYGKVTKTQPHKVLPNTPVVHKLAAPMPQPGVAKPTGPQAFTLHSSSTTTTEAEKTANRALQAAHKAAKRAGGKGISAGKLAQNKPSRAVTKNMSKSAVISRTKPKKKGK